MIKYWKNKKRMGNNKNKIKKGIIKYLLCQELEFH